MLCPTGLTSAHLFYYHGVMDERELRRRLYLPPFQVFTDRHISKIVMQHTCHVVNGVTVPGQYIIEVGKPQYEGGEVVRAILETTQGWYMVCTWSRGLKNKEPHWINPGDVVRVG
jgi:hypothetical protein